MPTRAPLIWVRVPALPVAMKASVGINVVPVARAVPSRKTGALTVVVVGEVAGRVSVVSGALTALTWTTIAGEEMAVLPVSSVATAKTLKRPGVLAL